MARRGSAIELSSGRLPRELLVLYLVAPLVTTPVLSGDFFRLAPSGLLRELVANCVAFLTIPPAIHQMYRRVMPRLLARCASFGGRLAVHIAISGAVTACVALAIYPIIDRLFDHGPRALTSVVRAVAVALVMVLPAPPRWGLAGVLRCARRSARRERVPLGDELAMAEDYLEIQRARFGERLRYSIDVERGVAAESEA